MAGEWEDPQTGENKGSSINTTALIYEVCELF